MIIYESKLEGTQSQYERLDEAIRTGRFVRNSIIRAWMDHQIKSRNSAYAYCKVLADSPEFPWAKQLNSQARQAHAEEESKELTGRQIGLDVGLNQFYTDSFGEKVDNPRFLRCDSRKIKRLQRRLSKTEKGSKNRIKARRKLGRAHLKVSRRRNDWACKLAQRVIQSNDLVAIENLKVRNMIKNHCLAKSIADVAWYRFREWLNYFGVVYGVPVIAVNPSYTSQNCSNCGQKVVKTLSTRTHRCPHCRYTADRDENAAINILKSLV